MHHTHDAPKISRGATRLGLGTVQFGLNYGITNSAGRVSEDEIARILRAACAAGIDVLDTAALYGESEAVIGRSAEARSFRVVSKTPKFDGGSNSEAVADHFRSGLYESLARTGRSALDFLLVHQASDLLAPTGEALWRAMERAKAEHLVDAIGVSIYQGSEIDALMARYPLDVVQLPLNAVDDRLVEGGQIDRLASRGIEIHARSVLLQGLLTVAPEQLEPRFAPLGPVLSAMRALGAEHGLSLLALLLGAVLRHNAVSRLIVGATNSAELLELVTAAEAAVAHGVTIDYKGFSLADTRILNPALWSVLG
jgi:aryl-alcohol dehydrogenase-like predicted oxidoreductase